MIKMIMMMRVITIVMIAMNKDADDLFLANILIAPSIIELSSSESAYD
jgi:hypothetical protein